VRFFPPHFRFLTALPLGALLFNITLIAQEKPASSTESAPSAPAAKHSEPRQSLAPNPSLEQLDLQRAIEKAGNDRAALTRNLLEFLQKYPQSSQRSQIYRAVVESSLQLRDFPTATEYAERLVALNPEDLNNNVLAVQLLEHYGDTAGWYRGTYYCSRVLDMVTREAVGEKSPRISGDEFERDKSRNAAAIILVRGRLYQKLNDLTNAEKDFTLSYKLLPAAPAAERLGELAEIRKDLPTAIHQYAIAFSLSDSREPSSPRADLRKKLGNVWRLAHGSEDGLGDYLIHTFDELSAANAPAKAPRNQGLKNPIEFQVRKAKDGSNYSMAEGKGKIVVMNFWATWCGPCREWEPIFERVASRYSDKQSDILFLEVNCDEDETLVPPYLAEEKPKSTVVFADGLERLLGVNAFPTTLVLDRTGKIAYRAEGMNTDTIDKTLIDAIEKALHPQQSASPSEATTASSH